MPKNLEELIEKETRDWFGGGENAIEALIIEVAKATIEAVRPTYIPTIGANSVLSEFEQKAKSWLGDDR